MKKEQWVMWGDSESGDHYDKVILTHQPTEADYRKYISEETPEELDIDGPGECGSYVHMDWNKVK